MLFDDFKRNAAEHPEALAFLEAAEQGERAVTWREFAHRIACTAHLLRPYANGARIGLLGENSVNWMCVHAACLFSGVVVVPLETTLTPGEIAERLAFTDARLLVHSEQYAAKAEAATRLLAGLHAVCMTAPGTRRLLERAGESLQKGGGQDVFSRPPRPADETAMIVFTSGTTSAPRGAELTCAGMSVFADFAASVLPFAFGAHSLMLLPLHHIYGLCTTYLMLARGVVLGVCPDFRRIYDDVARFKVDVLCLVPALVDMLAAKVERHGATFAAVLGKPIDWILSGGAPLSAYGHDRLVRLGAKPMQIYGLTETCALYAMSPYDDPRPGSVGLSCGGRFGMETRVAEDGSLQIRGPAVLRRYYRNPDRTAAARNADGWFDTGDLGTIDADGYVRIVGRKSRTIVLSSGKKVAPEEMEERLLALPGMREAVVSGDGASRELTAEVFADVPEETIRRQIDSLNRQLPVYKRLRRVVVRAEAFPRTASGKIRVKTPVVAAPVPARSGLSRRAASVSLAVALTAAMVLLMNCLPFVLQKAGWTLEGPLGLVFRYFEEWGEIVLALFALFAYFVSRRLFGADRAGGRSR